LVTEGRTWADNTHETGREEKSKREKIEPLHFKRGEAQTQGGKVEIPWVFENWEEKKVDKEGRKGERSFLI